MPHETRQEGCSAGTRSGAAAPCSTLLTTARAKYPTDTPTAAQLKALLSVKPLSYNTNTTFIIQYTFNLNDRYSRRTIDRYQCADRLRPRNVRIRWCRKSRLKHKPYANPSGVCVQQSFLRRGLSIQNIFFAIFVYLSIYFG